MSASSCFITKFLFLHCPLCISLLFDDSFLPLCYSLHHIFIVGVNIITELLSQFRQHLRINEAIIGQRQYKCLTPPSHA